MQSFLTILSLQATLFSLILIGMISARLGILRGEGRKMLSALLLNVILPFNILNSFLSDMQIGEGFALTVGQLIGISGVIQIFSLLFSRLAFRNLPRERYCSAAYGMLCSNSTFIGYPFAEALYGNGGIVLTSLFQIPIRLTMWSVGQALYTKIQRKDLVRKLLCNPCIIAVFLGLAGMLLKISLPGLVMNTISSVSKCTTPISMFVVGAILANASVKALFSRPVLWYSLLRLIVFPLLIFVALLPFPVDPTVRGIALLMSAMPAGSTVSILADKYGADADFASQLTFTSTLLSMITIPVLTMLL